MLQKLEQEIDDVDAKIGDRWRLLDRYNLEFAVVGFEYFIQHTSLINGYVILRI